MSVEKTAALCAQCLRRVPAELHCETGGVFLAKRCPEHGPERVLLADDVEYWRRARGEIAHAGRDPLVRHTPVEFGCPYDCGICADHAQHACLTIIEVCDACDLRCPVCYASSGPERRSFRSLATIESMLDAVVRTEGEPDVVQISGGEPAEHPEIAAILAAAKRRPIRHLMLNTNGTRIARDEDFARMLADLGPGFEVYLQFDSLEKGALVALRGADLRDVRRRALERLNRLGVSTTLVVTLKRGVNDDECGRLVDFALAQPCVRGVTFQPIQDAGRNERFDPARDRLTLTEVRRRIYEQTEHFTPDDLIPVPCHPEQIAMGYALKLGGRVVPLTRFVDPGELVRNAPPTIAFEHVAAFEPALRLFSTGASPAASATALTELLCCLPRVEAPAELRYENLFRVIVMQFLDAHTIEPRTVRGACVFFAHPDGRLIPFDTYNVLYRDRLESELLEPLRNAR